MKKRRTFEEWIVDTFFEEPLEIDEVRSWEDYIRLATLLTDSFDDGEWGGRISTDIIKGYLFWCWMEGIDYYTAVEDLKRKFRL